MEVKPLLNATLGITTIGLAVRPLKGLKNSLKFKKTSTKQQTKNLVKGFTELSIGLPLVNAMGEIIK